MAAPTQALFLSETFLKDNTPLTMNVDTAEVYPFLQSSQEMYIKPIIGCDLYDRLVAGMLATNLTPDETALLKKIRICLVWYVNFEALPFINYKMRNKGVLKTSGENSQNADIEEMRYLRQELKNKAEHFKSDLIYFLNKNVLLYPLFRSSLNCTCSLTSRTAYTCDIFIDERFTKNYLGNEFY
jgi:hypothetical protein